jgi:glycosyltransferase involved in cell wall biosynthesis
VSAIKWQAPRILFVTTAPATGGAEKALFQIATGRDPKLFSVSVVSLKPLGEYGKQLAETGITVHSLGQGRIPSPASIWALAKIIRKEKPALIHALMFRAIQLTRLARLLSGQHCPLVTSPHINYRSRSSLTLAFDRRFKNGDALTITECETTRQYLLKNVGYDPDKVLSIHNGVETAGKPHHIKRNPKRIEAGAKDGELLIGAMGRLDRQKNHALLIDALARLKGKFPFRCVILGEGPLRGDLEKLIRERGLEGVVSLPGETSEIDAWLSAFDLFIQPSLWEGFPYAVLEAMASGLAVIASRVDGVPEMIDSGKNGILVAPGEAGTLSRAIESLALDPGPRKKLGDAARKTVHDRFTVKHMVAEYQKAYSSVVQNPAG